MSETRKKYLTDWARAAAIRAVKTFAQAAVSAIPVTAATLGDVNFMIVFSTAGLAAILSLLTSLAGLPEVEPERSAEHDAEYQDD